MKNSGQKHPYSDDGYIVTFDLDLINDTIQ